MDFIHIFGIYDVEMLRLNKLSESEHQTRFIVT